MNGDRTATTMIPGGPDLARRASDACQAITEALMHYGLIADAPKYGAIGLGHDTDCKGVAAKDLELCSCETVEVTMTFIDEKTAAILETSGDYQDGGEGLRVRTRWPKED